jgi:hypothetical protein
MLRQLGFYVAMLRALESAGLGKPPWVPPRQHAAALAGTRPQAAGLALRLTDIFYAARYGGRSLDAQEARAAQQLVAELIAALRDGGQRPVIGA